MSHPESLKEELETFRRQLPSLKADYPLGHFAVIAGAVFLGAFASYDAALEAGYENAPSPKFLVKQIGSDDEVQHVVTPL